MGYTQGEMIALGFIFVILPTIFVGLRIWARFLRRAGLGADDYTILVGWVSYDFSKSRISNSQS